MFYFTSENNTINYINKNYIKLIIIKLKLIIIYSVIVLLSKDLYFLFYKI